MILKTIATLLILGAITPGLTFITTQWAGDDLALVADSVTASDPSILHAGVSGK
jgi:hypothetical protein